MVSDGRTNGLSEFGTDGPENIYECDTVRAELGGCRADFNGDGAVDSRDVIQFLNAWSSGQPSADWDGNGVVDSRDVVAFLNDWTAC